MGEGSPTVVGIALERRRSALVICESLYGVLARTCWVNLSSWASVGASTNESEPVSCLPMWLNPPEKLGLIGFFAMFGPVPMPLPVPITILVPSELTATADGYHPVGMKPATLLLPRMET